VAWTNHRLSTVPSLAKPGGITDPAAASRDVVIELKADGKIDVSYGGTLVLNNVQTPYDPAAIRTPKWVMGTRIGLANDNFWFDDLCIVTLPRPAVRSRLYNTGVNSRCPAIRRRRRSSLPTHLRRTDAFAATEAGGFPIPRGSAATR